MKEREVSKKMSSEPIPKRSIDGLSDGLKKFGVFASAVIAGLPAGSFFADHAPPNFAPITLLTSGLVPVAILYSFINSRPSDKLVGRSLLLMSISLVLLICYFIMLPFVTVQPPRENERHRVQIGFYMSAISLTKDAKDTMADPPGGIEINVPNDLMLAYGVWGRENDVFTVWKWWTVVAAGLILAVLFVASFCIWAIACGMMAKYFAKPDWDS